MIKRLLLIIFTFSLLSTLASAQSGAGLQYTLATSTLATFPTTGQVAIALGTRPVAVQDEWDTLIAPAGMSVNFAGVNYTKFVLSSNGWLALIPSTVASLPAVFTGNAFPSNSLSTWNTGYPIIAPIWDDLSSTGIVYNWNTNSLWVRWTCKWDKANAAAAGSLMWVRIDGITGQISFNYSNTAYTPSNASASMGIAGICTGDFYSFTPAAPSGATVTMDSTTENSTVALKPVNISYVLTPYVAFDNCTSPKDLGTITSSCTNFTWSNHFATAGSAMSCTAETKDAWFSYLKPANVNGVKFTTSPPSCGAVAGTTVEVFSSCGGTSLGCSTSGSAFPTFGEVTVGRPCVAETLYVKVTVDADAIGKFNICAVDVGTVVSPTTGTTCSNSTGICSLPFSVTGLSTAGFGNEYDSLNSACHDPFMNGEDYIFSYTPSSNICASFSFTSTGSNPALFVLDGCPNVAGTNCVSGAFPTSTSSTATISSLTLLAGRTYYFVVDNNPVSGTSSITFDLSITPAGSAPAYDPCGAAVNLGSVPFNMPCSYSTYTTECSSPSPLAGYPAPSCGSYANGVTGDVWLRFTAAFTGNLLITTQPGSANPISDAAMAIYTGSCGALSLYSCDDNSAGSSMPLLSIPVTNGTTYYIRVWTVSPGSNGQFNLCISSACAPANDLPCGAVFVPVGGSVAGSNVCAGGTSEPANSAQCIAGGTVNTVWFKTVVPASGQVRARTNTQTLIDTQIQGFTFASGCANSATTFTSRGCNDDGSDCGTQSNQSYKKYSDLLMTGLTPGDTLFVAVDGVGSLNGTFLITIADGTAPLPPIYLQDCELPYEVCGNSSITVADPGALNFGNICDFSTNYGCWNNPERNSNWYHFTCNPGTLQFTVNTPGDYDWIMWDVTGVTNACQQIQSISLPTVRCNWVTTTGQTGLSSTLTGGAWGAAITIPAGSPREYILLVNNWNPPFQITGYNIDWGGSPIASVPTTVTWQGQVDSLFNTTNNWGTVPCNVNPSCLIDATVAQTATGRYPCITTNTSVKNLTINTGASMRIKSGVTLNICGNLTVNGLLYAEPGSTIQFIGNSNATINGTLTGNNSFANLTINKSAITTTITGTSGTNTITVGSAAGLTVGMTVTGTGIYPGATITAIAGATITLSNNNLVGGVSGTGNFAGSVTLNAPIDVKQNFTIGNATSVFNINGKYMKVAGNFTNSSGRTTFTGYLASTVEFNGTTNQNFTNSTGLTQFYNVRMNQTIGRKLYMMNATSSIVIDTLGQLNLLSGVIVGPRPNGSQEVNILGNSTTAIINHNANSFVDGRLRRKIYNNMPLSLPLALEFPVGDSVSPGGYNLAILTYTSGTVIPDVVVYFNPWPTLPPPNGPVSSECVVADYSQQQLLNNGYWTFFKQSSSFNGQYSITLRNQGYTTTGLQANSGFTVVRADINANPMLQASWGLLGTCVTTSTVNNTQRIGFNSPALSSSSLNHLYATAWNLTPLPIELLSFTAEPSEKDVICKWETASEINNLYFIIERSVDGVNFREAGRKDGFGAGTTTTLHSYHFTDINACGNVLYYRLKQVDIDGQFTYSPVVSVACDSKGNRMEVYPNPAGSMINCAFNSIIAGSIRMDIIDMFGHTVQSTEHSTAKGLNTISSDISELTSGVYYIRIISSEKRDEFRIARFVKN